MKMLSTDQVRQYHETGFVLPFRAASPDSAARYRAEVERTCAVSLGASPLGASYRTKPYLLFTWAASLVREPAVLDAVEDLIGPDILVFHTTLWWKQKGSAKRVPWHQDGTYFGLAPFEHVTAWVALSPSTEESGCVTILPGTHKAGQLPHYDAPDPKAMLSRGQTLRQVPDTSRAVPIPPRVKRHLGLDADASWIVLDESNEFLLPGPDLRPVSRAGPGVWSYAVLPLELFAEIQAKQLNDFQESYGLDGPEEDISGGEDEDDDDDDDDDDDGDESGSDEEMED